MKYIPIQKLLPDIKSYKYQWQRAKFEMRHCKDDYFYKVRYTKDNVSLLHWL